jgi:hypothetical protein
MTLQLLQQLMAEAFPEAFAGNVHKPVFSIVLPENAYLAFGKHLQEIHQNLTANTLIFEKTPHVQINSGYMELRIRGGKVFNAKLLNTPEHVAAFAGRLKAELKSKQNDNNTSCP